MKSRLGRRNSFAVLLCAILLGLGAEVAHCETYGGGTGEPNDPFRIATAEDLNDILDVHWQKVDTDPCFVNNPCFP